MMENDAVNRVREEYLRENKKRTEEEMRRKNRRRKIAGIVLAFMLLNLLFAWGALRYLYSENRIVKNPSAGAALSAQRVSVTERYRDILTEDEIEEWNTTEAEQGKVFLKLNTQMHIENGTRANIRLLHPPYCVYDCKIQITDRKKNLLYQSEVLTPGTVLESVLLKQRPEQEKEPVQVHYMFYESGTEEVIGVKDVDAVLVSVKESAK